MDNWIIVGCLVAIGVLLLLVIRLSIHLAKLESSMAKLGYVIREDAKKYFDDAAHAVVEVNENFEERNSQIIREGTRSALADTGAVMADAIAKAQQDAGTVVLGAREEARRIVETAKQESAAYKQQALDQSTTTIQWTLEQYVTDVFSPEQHEALIKRLVDQHSRDDKG